MSQTPANADELRGKADIIKAAAEMIAQCHHQHAEFIISAAITKAIERDRAERDAAKDADDRNREFASAETATAVAMSHIRNQRTLAELYEEERAKAESLKKQLAEREAELAEMEARAVSLALHLPPDTLAGDVQKWRDEIKAKLAEQSAALASLIKAGNQMADVSTERRRSIWQQALAQIEALAGGKGVNS